MKTGYRYFCITLLLLNTLILTACGGGEGSAVNAEPASLSSTAKTSNAPPDVNATSGIHKITISWSPVSGAESYNIYWSDNPGVTTTNGSKIAGAATPYIHDGLLVSKTYFYVVTAVINGVESEASSQAATVAGTDGFNLYDKFCAGCHGNSTNISNGTIENIKAAIASNKGGMGILGNLPEDNIATISSRLPCH